VELTFLDERTQARKSLGAGVAWVRILVRFCDCQAAALVQVEPSAPACLQSEMPFSHCATVGAAFSSRFTRLVPASYHD
jgi:hypothetical protein